MQMNELLQTFIFIRHICNILDTHNLYTDSSVFGSGRNVIFKTDGYLCELISHFVNMPVKNDEIPKHSGGIQII